MRRSALLAVAAAALLLAAGCGGSSGGGTSATEAWADGLCTAIADWTTAISSVGESLRNGTPSEQSVADAADEASSATETLASDLDALGRPDTEAGRQAKEAVDQLATDLEAGVTKIQDALDSASGISGIVRTASVLGSTLATMGDQVGATISSFEELDAKGELEAAFKQSESCQKLAG